MSSFKAVLQAKKEQQEKSERPKVEWFSLKNGETKYVRFLQEFDEDMRNYDSTLGTALFLTEHVSPTDWSHKALCSMEAEGRCFACEMDKEQPYILTDERDPEGNFKKKWHPWQQKSNFYVYTVDNKGAVKVLSRPTNNKLFDALVEEIEENDNSLTDITFKLSKGPNKSDSWEVRKTTKEHFDVPEIPELVDLKTAVGYKVEYADQRSFYIPDSKDSTPAVEAPKEDSTTIGENW